MKLNYIIPLTFALGAPLSVQAVPLPGHSNAMVFSAAADTAEDLKPTVDAFRSALGSNNGNAPVSGDPNGHRSINWDAAPDSVSDPNAFSGDFFNFNQAPRARGIEFVETGETEGFELSSTQASGQPVAFGSSNAFVPFSPERMFSPVGGNTFEVHFFDPANKTEDALSRGLGIVFNDVDLTNLTQMTLYDQSDSVIFNEYVEPSNNAGLSFLGAVFDSSIIAYAAITIGTDAAALIQNSPGTIVIGVSETDFVAMDDFIFGEPINVSVAAVPVPGAAPLLVLGLAAMGAMSRRKTS